MFIFAHNAQYVWLLFCIHILHIFIDKDLAGKGCTCGVYFACYFSVLYGVVGGRIQVYLETFDNRVSGCKSMFLYGNYTGYIMNFDMAAEMLDMDDIRTTSIVGADDVLSNKDAQVRRGVAGIFFMYKCAGAMAARMGTLEEVLDAAKKAKENTRTVGFALTPCVIPEIGHSNFTLAEDEMAFGMGIHGEPGVWNGPVKTANDLAEESVGEILGDMPLNPGEEVCLLINGLGATSQEELYILSGSVHRILEEKGIKVYRTFVGEYATSMEMAGASISICRMADQEMKQWIDMPVHTPFYTQV